MDRLLLGGHIVAKERKISKQHRVGKMRKRKSDDDIIFSKEFDKLIYEDLQECV